MATNSWSNQVLVQDEYRKGDEVRTENALIVCNRGIDLFQEAFIDGKYNGQNHLTMPFDFIVLGGCPCPRGKFFEVEFTIGGNTGLMHRALIQAVKPEDDLQIIIGALQHKGVVPTDIFTHKAYLRDDIEGVQIVGCYRDEETNEPYISGGHITPVDDTYSVLDKLLGKDQDFPAKFTKSVCLEFYADDHCVEVWIDGSTDKFDSKPVFVSGGSNVFDPAFADMREADLNELLVYINDAVQIAQDYGLQYIFCYETGEKHPDTGNPTVNLMNCCSSAFAAELSAYILRENREVNEQG